MAMPTAWTAKLRLAWTEKASACLRGGLGAASAFPGRGDIWRHSILPRLSQPIPDVMLRPSVAPPVAVDFDCCFGSGHRRAHTVFRAVPGPGRQGVGEGLRGVPDLRVAQEQGRKA